ncbi:hypothetical protein OG500_38095 [Kitasatospora sp. NBC_01250]|uniref:hypothetical protein n=1 Tax=Kitasatospora sp. NBC_01250 TaxID=2903571 RepID=UPI002E35556D|nr:hypothetical protein [Kitasatospora sp. NBC_01250]
MLTREDVDPRGELVFACLLHLAGHPHEAQWWWQYATGAGTAAAACTCTTSAAVNCVRQSRPMEDQRGLGLCITAALTWPVPNFDVTELRCPGFGVNRPKFAVTGHRCPVPLNLDRLPLKIDQCPVRAIEP